MLALTFDGSAARVREREAPKVPLGFALVKVHLAGICNTDLEICRGYMGFEGVLGHELVGTVIEGPAAWLGRRVVVEINFACGTCAMCQEGLSRHCPTRTVMGILGADGAFAEQVAVPIANLHAVPDALSDDQAVFAEPLAAAFEVLDQVHVRPASKALVLGDGKLGSLIAMVLQQAGVDVHVGGKNPEKLARLAKQGISTGLSSDLGTGLYGLVVEATGSAEGLGLAMAHTRPRGTLVLKSTVADPTTAHLAPLVIHEITVVGSRCGSFPPALRALQAQRVDVSSLVSDRFALKDGERALEQARQRGVMKVLLEVA